mmetsp:Transcript_42633/g.109704  ORF Transcript_42633/g.109704 Transcript_42633/m.109704 type:complete len:88 (+) Transcript_42633:6617-6880(+)
MLSPKPSRAAGLTKHYPPLLSAISANSSWIHPHHLNDDMYFLMRFSNETKGDDLRWQPPEQSSVTTWIQPPQNKIMLLPTARFGVQA